MKKIYILCIALFGTAAHSLTLPTFSRGAVCHTTIQTPLPYDVIAEDGSEVRLLARVEPQMSSIEATLPPGRIAKAIYHQTVLEIWHVTEGEGYFWRRDRATGAESCVKIVKGTTLTIPKETDYQFRATGTTPLKFFIATTPAWPGPQEPVPVPGHWVIPIP